MNLWDSTLTEAQAYDRPEFDPPKSKSHFTAKLDKTPENQWVSAKPFPLWDACDSKTRSDPLTPACVQRKCRFCKSLLNLFSVEGKLIIRKKQIVFARGRPEPR